MAKKIYNKNAREKALLEEAYQAVREGVQGKLARGAGYKGPLRKLGDKAKGVGEKIVDKAVGDWPGHARLRYDHSKGDWDEELKRREEREKRQDARRKRLDHEAEFKRIAPHVDAEDAEGSFEGAYVSGTEEVEAQPDLGTLEGSFQAKKNPSVRYQYRVSQGETIPSLEPNEQGQYAQDAPEGNIILTGVIKTGNTPNGEQWSQKPEKFQKDYKKVSETEAVAVGANPVAMRQLSKPFKVHTSWGSVLEGKPGDLLTQYGVGDYGVLDQDAFKAYYVKA